MMNDEMKKAGGKYEISTFHLCDCPLMGLFGNAPAPLFHFGTMTFSLDQLFLFRA